MGAAIVAGAVTLTAALIAALIALHVKRLDLLGHGKQRRAEALKKGYDQALTAMDTAWHFHCHSELSNLGWEIPFDWGAKWPSVRDEILGTLSSAIDLLKANSHNYQNVSAVLQWACRVIMDGYTLKMRKSMPEDYAEVRDSLVHCSRIDDNLEKPVKKAFWKKFKKQNQPRPPESGDERLSRMSAMLREAFIHGNQDATFITQDQDTLIAYIESFEKHPPIFVPSLTLSWRRMKTWSSEGFLDAKSIPCFDLDPPCYVAASERLRER